MKSLAIVTDHCIFSHVYSQDSKNLSPEHARAAKKKKRFWSACVQSATSHAQLAHVLLPRIRKKEPSCMNVHKIRTMWYRRIDSLVLRRCSNEWSHSSRMSRPLAVPQLNQTSWFLDNTIFWFIMVIFVQDSSEKGGFVCLASVTFHKIHMCVSYHVCCVYNVQMLPYSQREEADLVSSSAAVLKNKQETFTRSFVDTNAQWRTDALRLLNTCNHALA